MFSSSQTVNLDAKGRMAMPTRFREQLIEQSDGHLVVTLHQIELCLVLYPANEWKTVLRKLTSLPEGDIATRNFKRRIMGNAKELEMDANGRILIDSRLREIASLDKKVLVSGLGNKFELWPEDEWLSNHSLTGKVDEEALPPSLRELAL